MKKYIYTFAVCLFMASCSQDFLDTTPATEFSENSVWSDPSLAETLINNLYFRLDEPLTDGRFKANITDEAHYRGNAPSLNFNRGLHTSDGLLGWTYSRYRTWDDQYKSIRFCNIFLNKVGEIPFTNAIIDGKT